MVNKVRLTIAGSPYVISTTDSEEYVTNLAQKLDADIASVMEENPNLSVTRAAVFCALDYLADAAKAKLAADEARREVERLKREVQTLKERAQGSRG